MDGRTVRMLSVYVKVGSEDVNDNGDESHKKKVYKGTE